MMKQLTTLIFALGLASGAYGAYAGSVVSSWYAAPIKEGGHNYYPLGLTYGDGYIWIPYAYSGFLCRMTKRLPENGSIVTSFPMDVLGLPPKLGWRQNLKYLYGVSQTNPIQWFDSHTGSRVGSFRVLGAFWPSGIDYDETHPGKPIWLCQWGTSVERPPMIWNLTQEGIVVASFDMRSKPVNPDKIAYGDSVPGGPYLYVGTTAAPTLVHVMNPKTGSLYASFRAPISDRALSDMTWDGRYLWALENGGYPPPPNLGWVYRFVAHGFPAVGPASVGKIKALYR